MGILNVEFRAAFHIQGLKQVYVAETMAFAVGICHNDCHSCPTTSTPIQGRVPLSGQTYRALHAMSGDLSSHCDARGISWRRLLVNGVQLLPSKNFDCAMDLIMQPGRLLWMASTTPKTRTHNSSSTTTHNNSISRYVSKLPSIGCQAHAIKLALRGHTPYVIANIHGPFSRDRREKPDDWLAHLPDLGILMGDFADCVWGRSSQPTRYWHPLLAAGDLLYRMLAHAPSTNTQNLATHFQGRRLDAILFSPAAWVIQHPHVCRHHRPPPCG